jgi:hypothetical protein
MDFFVTARSIRDWATKLDARATLPHIVRRLVTATATGIDEVDFPAHESIQRPGFDGVVECSSGNAWVPTGRSVWELSTDQDVPGKANNDFKKRTANTPRDEQEQCIYVCLTPRQFTNKNEWSQKKEKEGGVFWRGVRAYDADDLEQWTESAPAGITAWLGRQIGSRPQGVDDVAQRWSAIAKASASELLPAVFLAGRERSVQRIQEWLSAPPGRLGLDCRSPVEVVDFFCAVVAAMMEEDRVATEARAVIIYDRSAWEVLRDRSYSAVLIVDPSLALSNEEIARAVSNRHHVLLATEPTIMAGQGSCELERASEFELTKALEASGYTPVKAEQFARAAGGSLAILKNCLAQSTSRTFPRWALDVAPDVVAACLLLGGWGNNEADQIAFGLIAGLDYPECEAELQLMANSLEPLLIHAAGNWRLISKDHAWSLFQDRVAPPALKRFESLAAEVLADDDPRYLLADGERFYANIQGHVPKYSETIKKHIAETLAFLGAFGSKLEAAASINIEAAVGRIVAAVLPATCTWHRWASLGSRLPLLAEASPMSFLRAVREDLDRASSELVTLLHEEEEGVFGRCNHAGLLRALEGLAWPREFVGEVAQTLLRLASQDTAESRSRNRPGASLCEILSYWMPQTMASVEERGQILDLLILCDRDAIWSILLELLPGSANGVSNPTHKPYWRGWADNWVRGATRGESLTFITATARRVIEQAEIDAKRWKDIFGQIGCFPYTVRQQFLEAADVFSRCEISDTERRLLSDELSEQINRHRYFSDADWALPPEMLDALEQVLERIKPRSCVLRNAWLFEQWPHRFFERGGDQNDNQAALDNARQAAMREILASDGFGGVESLAEHAESPYEVGRMLAMTTGDTYLSNLVPARLEGSPRDIGFAGGFIWNRFWPENWNWIDEALLLCPTPNAKANLLTTLRFSPNVWRRASNAGVETSDLYWNRCRAFNPDLDPPGVATAVQTLCRYQRPAAAIDLLSMAIHQKRDLDAETLFAPLELLLTLPAEALESPSRTDGFHIQEIIGALQARDDVDEVRLIRIEWHYIKFLDEQSKVAPQTLQKHLSSSPEFFNEVLSLCYRSRSADDEGDVPEPSAYRQYMAEHGFRLLHEWDRVPGTGDNGTVDEGVLRDWCVKARHIAKESGRNGVCDSHIGQLFAKSKQQDENGTLPCLAIRRVACEIATESLESGMVCGIRNLRGACFRATGGSQERDLAREFRSRADRIRFESLFVAQVLDSVAQGYENEAEWWDERDRWDE